MNKSGRVNLEKTFSLEVIMTVQIIGSKSVDVRPFLSSGVAGITPRKLIKFSAEKEVDGVMTRIHSPGCYMNCRVFPSHPAEWGLVLNRLFFASLGIPHETIASVETGAVSHGVALALRNTPWKPHVSVKKEIKGYGISGLIAGDMAAVEGRQVLVVEDVGTTGESARRAVEILREAGAVVTGVLMLATYDFPDLKQTSRELGVSFHALCSFEWILDVLVAEGQVSEEYDRMVRAWLRDPWKKWTWPQLHMAL